MKKKSSKLILIGFQSAGKTTIGQNLSQELKIELVDTDHVIENHHPNFSCREIYKQFGEIYFRHVEKHICLDLNQQQHPLISVGGGAPLECFDSSFQFIYLQASLAFLEDRVKAISKAAYLQNNSISNVYAKRTNYYQQFATQIINVESKSVAQIIQNIRDYHGI